MNDRPPAAFDGRYYDFVIEDGWEYLRPACFDDVVLIVPVTDDGAIVLVEQHRVPAGGPVIELPAGLVGDRPEHRGEGILDAARRELLEETGYAAADMEIAAAGMPSAGSNSLSVSLVLATGLRKVGPGGGDGSESIRVMEIPLADAERRLEGLRDEGFALDLKIYAGLWFVRDRCGR